eukprot:1159929-Pelagomonas_calceolata.AAC.1
MSGRLHLPSAPWHLRVSPSCIRPRTTCIGGPSPACLALPCPRPHHNLHQQHRTLRGRDCAVRAGSCCSAASEPPQQNSNTTHEHQHGNHSHFPDSFLTGFFERLGLVAAAERCGALLIPLGLKSLKSTQVNFVITTKVVMTRTNS